MRIIKTAIALVVAMVLSDYVLKLFLKDLDTNAVCVFAMLSVQDSVEGTWKFVLERFFGNVMGLASGFLFLFLFELTGTRGIEGDIISGNFVFYAFVALGTIVAIYLCKMIHRVSASVITIIVFLGIMFGASKDKPYLNAAYIVLQMVLGVIIAVTINLLIMRPKPKKSEFKKEQEAPAKEDGVQLTFEKDILPDNGIDKINDWNN